jgi:hypothetical protein
VEEFGLRRIQILRRHIGRERPPAEADDAAFEIADREDDAIAEAIERDGNVVAGDEKAGGDHLLLRDVLRREVLLQRSAIGRRVADAEFALKLGAEAAVHQVAPGGGAGPALQRRLEEFRRDFHHLVEARPLAVALLGVRVARRHRHAGLAGQTLDRLGERKAFRLHHEGEDVAVLLRREIKPLALLVIDEEGGRLLGIERRQPGELATLLLQLHPPPDDARHRQARADFVEEGIGEAHGTRAAESAGAGGWG